MKELIKTEPFQIFTSLFGAFFFISMNTVVNYPYGLSDSMWLVITGAVWFTIGMSWVHAQSQARYIAREKHPKHGLLFIVRGIIGLTFSYIVHKDLPHFSQWDFTTLYNSSTVRLTLLMGACFWISFDLLLNYYRDKPIFYVSEYYRTAFLDKMLRKIFSGSKPHFLPMWLTKVAVFIWTIQLYLK